MKFDNISIFIVAVNCGAPPNVQNYVGISTAYGSEISSYQCADGYMFPDQTLLKSSVFCLSNVTNNTVITKWSEQCIRK